MTEVFNREKLVYRNGVDAYVLNDKNQLLLVQKQNYGEDQWAFPGGGIEGDEGVEEGLWRELNEELGTSKFKIIRKSKYTNKFEWPDDNVRNSIREGKNYRGQEKHIYVLRFLGSLEDITVQEEEIRRIKWVDLEKLEEHLVFPNQFKIAKKVLEEFGLKMK